MGSCSIDVFYRLPASPDIVYSLNLKSRLLRVKSASVFSERELSFLLYVVVNLPVCL